MADNQIFKPSYKCLIPWYFILGIPALFLFFLLIIFVFQATMITGGEGTAFFIIFLIVLFCFIIFCGILALFGFLAIKMTSYELRPDGIYIKKGIIAKKQILLLYSQIQDITENQDLLSRIVGIKSLQVRTMTSSSLTAGMLSNLRVQDADQLKKELQQLSGSAMNKKGSASTGTVEKTPVLDLNLQSANPYPLHYTRMGVISLLCVISLFILAFAVGNAFDIDLFFKFIGMWIFLIFAPFGFFIRQATNKYWVGEDRVTIKSGWLNTQQTSIVYGKIQDIIYSQGIIARILGLASLKLETGSAVALQQERYNRGPNFDIYALAPGDANTLAHTMLKSMGKEYSVSKDPLVSQMPLCRKKIWKKTVTALIGYFFLLSILLAIILIVSRAASLESAILLVLLSGLAVTFVIIGLIVYVYQRMYYDRYFYDSSKDTLVIRKGVIGKKQIFLPFGMIQNVFLDQDLLDRAFGLYDVHLSTVGQGSIRMCHIDGLTKENADKMVAFLMGMIKKNC